MNVLSKLKSGPSIARGASIKYRPELDGIRGFAIILIVFHHFDYVGLHYFQGRGFLGVDIFFVLSGFLITQILLKYREGGKKLRFFYLRRIARLYPILLVSTLGLSYYLRNDYQFLDQSPAIRSILYIKNFWPWGGLFGPMWSLSAEEQFYLIFPVTLLVGMKYLKRRGLTILLALWLLAIWSVALMSSAPDYNFNSDGVFNLVLFRPSIILVGSLVALHLAKLEDLVTNYYYLFMGTFVVLVYFTINFQFPPLAGLATGILIVALSEKVRSNHLPAKAIGSLFAFKPIAWVGLLSYSIYIWHLPMIFFVTDHFTIRAIPSIPLFFVKLLAISIVSFYLFERPILKLLTKKVKVK